MKKAIANLIFLIVCIAGIIFLLLPFLETVPPATTQLNSAQPQVSSSNPLATIAKRLASLFGRHPKERKGQSFSARDGYDVTSPEFLTQVSNPPVRAASVPAGSVSAEGIRVPQPNQQIPVPGVTQDEYGNASLQTDDGEWVLIRQTAPPNGAPGMHEVNVHENPYDKYIKQEQARRFHPVNQKADIPDSKWARLLRPVKKFFGIEGARPAENRPLGIYRETTPGSSALASAKNYSVPSGARRLRSSWPDITPAQWSRMSEQQRERERERRSAAEFIELLSGTRAAEDAAAIEAEAKYPDPKDEGKRESYRLRLTEEKKQAMKQGMLAAMQQNAEGQEAVDELEHIMSGCSNASLPKPLCLPDQQEPKNGLFSADELAAGQEKSRQTFLEMTRYVMPNDLPLLPVLGPTMPETIANMSGAAEDVNKTIEIYQFLYQQNKCDAQDCFWIPNTLQSNSHLNEAFQLANAKLVTDPDKRYPSLKQDFVRYQVEQAQKQQAQNPDASFSEEQIRQEAEKQFTENAANWIPVTADQLKDLHQKHTLEPAQPQNAQSDADLAIPYLTNPVYAAEMYHILGDSPIFGYAEEPLTSVEKEVLNIQDATQADKQIVQHTGELINHSLASNVNTAFRVMEDVTQHAVSEGTRAGLNQGIIQFNQSGQNWGDMLRAIHNRNNRTQPSDKK